MKIITWALDTIIKVTLIIMLFLLGIIATNLNYNKSCIPYRNDAQQFNQYGR